MLNIMFDNDIGSDVDDALALAVLLGSPEINLVGVTTVYGDTELRAQIASRLIRLASYHHEVPCVPGTSMTLTRRAVWWAGHEGREIADLESEPVHDEEVVQFLLRNATEIDELHLLCTGPLTNVARTILADRSFSKRIGGLTIMGGAFLTSHNGQPEHNFASDPEAASVVLHSGIPLTIVPLDVTQTLAFGTADVARITNAGALGKALAREIEQWWSFNDEVWNVPHDPVAAVSLLIPTSFVFESADVSVRVDDTPGLSLAVQNEASASRYASGIDAPSVGEAIMSRIERAGTKSALMG